MPRCSCADIFAITLAKLAPTPKRSFTPTSGRRRRVRRSRRRAVRSDLAHRSLPPRSGHLGRRRRSPEQQPSRLQTRVAAPSAVRRVGPSRSARPTWSRSFSSWSDCSSLSASCRGTVPRLKTRRSFRPNLKTHGSSSVMSNRRDGSSNSRPTRSPASSSSESR